MVFQTLNKLKWTGKLEKCKVVFLSRGSPRDRKTIHGDQITQIKKSYFYFSEKGKETFIPLHGVLEIWIGRKLLWKRKEKP